MFKKRFGLFVLVLVALLSVSACTAGVRTIRGSGDLVTETRQVRNFDSIVLSGSGEVIVTQGNGESLTVETDDNVMEYVEAKVESGILKLGLVTGTPTGINVLSFTRLVFYVNVDDLSSLSTSGSGKIESERIETDRLDLSVSGSGAIQIANLSANAVNADISGSGKIDLVGDVETQEIDISGSGKYAAGDMCSQSVQVSISGSGNATICATETLDADVSGSGSVDYYGHPAIKTSESGSGKINSLGDN